MFNSSTIVQVGACIVGGDQIILGIGYNGFPRGCPDGKLPWAKLSHSGNKLETKYPYVVHAEANSILNAKNTPTLAGAVRVPETVPGTAQSRALWRPE